jgi:hypothetical protein
MYKALRWKPQVYHLKICFALIKNPVSVLLACARQTADTQGKKLIKSMQEGL